MRGREPFLSRNAEHSSQTILILIPYVFLGYKEGRDSVGL